ncbi:MAG: serine/threonine-protein kinase [Pirellulaceae bacterium]
MEPDPKKVQDDVAPHQDTVRGETSADLDDAAGFTASAPSFPRELPDTEHRSPGRHASPTALDVLPPGHVVEDFEIIALLGRGAAGAVYLARQRSLDRRVALKITRDVGSEARTMATLEHPHIVPVFSETVRVEQGQRLLCMQYVPGVTLADVIRKLRQLPRSQLSGRMLLEAIDAAAVGETAFDADALRGRELLENADYVQAVCWIVARLAEALHFAHRRGVLHRDIKPANILIDPYGRPRLADFSLSQRETPAGPDEEEPFGGTIPYMAPEHLDAFNPQSPVTPEAVDERSDIYGLGVVLYEMLAFSLPHSTPNVGQRIDAAMLTNMARQRQTPPAPLRTVTPAFPLALDTAIARCLAGAPEDRYADAGRMADALDGCRQLLRSVEQLPKAGPITRLIEYAPLAAAIPLSFWPHILCNVFTPAYNFLILFPRLTSGQRGALIWMSVVYGLVMFPLQAAVVVKLFGWSAGVWMNIKRGQATGAADVQRARRRLLTVPVTAVVMSLTAWIPLLFCVPACLFASGAGMRWSELGHFLMSVVVSLLLAAMYTFLVLQFFIVRVIYPRMWADASEFASTARRELAAIPMRLRWSQSGAGLVPLFGAILIVILGPEAFAKAGDLAFRLLLLTLIVFGMCGMPFALHIGGLITRSIDALTDAGDSDRHRKA